MVILGKRKKEEEEKEGSFQELEQFSKEMIELGSQIGEQLMIKEDLEARILEKEKEIRRMRSGLFQFKEKLIKVKMGLMELEKRRQEIENKQGL